MGVIRTRGSAEALVARGLTGSEQEVLALLMRGASNEEIGRARGRSVKTVANQLASIFVKLGVQSRTEAVLKVRGSPPTPRGGDRP